MRQVRGCSFTFLFLGGFMSGSSSTNEAVYRYREEEEQHRERRYVLCQSMALEDEGNPHHCGHNEKSWLEQFLEKLEKDIQ